MRLPIPQIRGAALLFTSFCVLLSPLLGLPWLFFLSFPSLTLCNIAWFRHNLHKIWRRVLELLFRLLLCILTAGVYHLRFSALIPAHVVKIGSQYEKLPGRQARVCCGRATIVPRNMLVVPSKGFSLPHVQSGLPLIGAKPRRRRSLDPAVFPAADGVEADFRLRLFLHSHLRRVSYGRQSLLSPELGLGEL